MPVVPYLMTLQLGRNQFIQTINCSFTLSSLVMAFGLGQLGLFSRDDLLISVIGACFVFIGLKFGTVIRHRLSEKLFRNALMAMLTVMGLSLVAPVLF
jgi:uncharacterized membrane protein YfcA